MYIGAAQQRVISLERFIGDDIWVKVRLDSSYKQMPSAGFYFIKPLALETNEHGSKVCKFCYVSIKRLSRGGVLYCTTRVRDDILKYSTGSRYLSDINIFNPIYTITTDELFVCSDLRPEDAAEE